MDMAQHESLGLGSKQGAGGELMVEARHRDPHRSLRQPNTVPCDTPGHWASPGCARAGAAGRIRPAALQLLAHSLRRIHRPGDGGHRGLVHRRQAGKPAPQYPAARSQAPCRRRHPAAPGQRHLLNAISDMDGMASTTAEYRQRAWRLVRVGPLQHEDRAVFGEAAHLRHQPGRSGRMQIECMVRCVASITAACTPSSTARRRRHRSSGRPPLGSSCRSADRRKLCDTHGASLVQAMWFSSASILSR